MDKLFKILTLLYSILFLHAMAMPCLAHSHSVSPGPDSVQEWFKTLPNAKEQLTKIRLYIHDVVSGKNPTAITVAQSNSSATSPTDFGVVNVMDDALTVGPVSDSEILGRARGIYALNSLDEVGMLMTFSIVFTSGKYNGSTLSVVGHNRPFHKYREMPVVGGSGVFRLARGVVTAQTVWFNATTGDAVVEYNVMAMHY